MLEATAGPGRSPFEQAWVSQARSVLARAEARVAGDLRAARAAAVKGLYVIVGPEATRGRPVVEVAEAALKGGAGLVQLRDKDGEKGAALRAALELMEMCAEYDALFIVNDDADVARATDAHGLHLGQDDLPVRDARRVLSSRQIVGRSNNTLDEAMESQVQEADYIAVGAVYPTATMGKQAREAIGSELVRQVKERVGQPVVAIGGIDSRQRRAGRQGGSRLHMRRQRRHDGRRPSGGRRNPRRRHPAGVGIADLGLGPRCPTLPTSTDADFEAARCGGAGRLLRQT